MESGILSDGLCALDRLARNNPTPGEHPLRQPRPARLLLTGRSSSSPAVAVTRANGLEVRFSGTENVAFSGVRQFTVVPPGRYRLSAEVSSDNLTTDQGPFFRIFDLANPSRLNLETGAIEGTVARSWMSVDFHGDGSG